MNRTKKSIFLLSIAFLFSSLLIAKETDFEKKYDLNCPEKKIAVIIPSYNNQKWYRENLDSLINQNYQNYYAIYINDCSEDATGKLIAEYISANNLENKILFINNKERLGPLANIYNAIFSCDNDTIIAILDGDDKLAHNNVLKVVNSLYQNKDIWMTYGQYKVIPNNVIIPCTKYTKEDVENNNFRKDTMQISHLKTFYAGLFKLIKFEDLLYEGKFYPMSQDKATMLPIIEMTGHRHKYISDILYFYNNSNPISFHRTDLKLQKHLANVIRNKKPYEPVTWEDIINA